MSIQDVGDHDFQLIPFLLMEMPYNLGKVNGDFKLVIPVYQSTLQIDAFPRAFVQN